jgi:hypothetical protein
MKKNIIITIVLALLFSLTGIFSGCQLINNITNKVPEQYIEGIKYDRDFPDNDIEIYDGAIVFESQNLFDEIVLTMGTEDDLDDVIDFYKEFFEDNSIQLKEESDERDEYYAHGFYEGYEFKIKAEEADGEYVEELFECVIYISAREASDTQLNAATPSTQPSETVPAETEVSQTSAAPSPTPAPKPSPSDSSGETPASYIEPGSWTLVGDYVNGQELILSSSMFLGVDGTGTYYYFNYSSDLRYFYYFTYYVENGKFYITIEGDSSSSTYSAYLDDGILHLVSEDATEDMYFVNWSERTGVNLTGNNFTAYGDWLYYVPETGYSETISFWPDGSGYIYNWNGSGENVYMDWDYDNGTFIVNDFNGNEYSYGIEHRGEVFELWTSDGGVYFYDRVAGDNWLTGYFSLDESDDDALDSWSLSLYNDDSCDCNVNGTSFGASWWIDSTTGKLNIYSTEIDFDFAFDYHYDIEGLYLWDAQNMAYYHFLQIG